MANFKDKILYLKTLMVEDGVGEVLERLKTMLMHNKQKLNDLLQFEGRLRKLNSDLGFEFITRDKYNSELANLRKVLLDFLDALQPEDLQPPTERKANRKKKNRGHLLHRIPKQMQLFKRTKCVVRLANVMEDLLENYKMTDDTVIKSIRVAEVMEVDLQDRNADTAFEITTPNDKEQFLDDDDFTEWIFYVKPIREGQHELTLVVTVLEEVKGKERRRNVVLEEVVTIVSEDVVEDTVYQSTGYEIGSNKVVDNQPFLGFMKAVRKYSAVVVLFLLGTLGVWAFGTESGQYQIASWQNTEVSYEQFIEKYENNKESQDVEKARWKKAILLDTEESYEEYLEETEIGKYKEFALEYLEIKVYNRVMSKNNIGNIESLKDYIDRFSNSSNITEVQDTLAALKNRKIKSSIININNKKEVRKNNKITVKKPNEEFSVTQNIKVPISNEPRNKFTQLSKKNDQVKDSIDLSYKELVIFPRFEINNRLVYLNLGFNNLTKIPSISENFPLLEELYLHSNQISKVENLEKITTLKRLVLSKNEIIKIQGLEKLIELEVLNLFENQISEIEGLEKLIKLQALYLGRNQLTNIRALERLINLKELNVSHNRLTSITGLERLINLEELNLNYNRISKIEGIEKLSKLRKLKLIGNNISQLTEIQQLINLEELYLSDNQITDISVLEKFTKLKTLDLNVNQITNISVLKKLVKLEKLYLHGNQITDISGLEQLLNLKKLDLSGNHLPLSEIERLKTILPNCEITY